MSIENYLAFLLSIFLSIFFSANFLCKFKKKLYFCFDNYHGIQKVHLHDATRLGGLSIIISTSFILFINFDNYYSYLFISFTLPIFIIGFIEDLTNKLSVHLRLLSLFILCLILTIFNNSIIEESDVFFLNIFLFDPMLAVVFSAFGILVTCNSWNFIDGLNGLSSGLGSLIILGFSYIAKVEGLHNLSEALFLVFLCVFGFYLINIFSAKIFLGDSGAYFLGVIISISGIEIANKSENISAWAIFFIIIYPATEIIFTSLRRVFQKRSPFYPDNMHYHSLLLKSFKKLNFQVSNKIGNSISGFVCTLLGIIPLVIFLFFNLTYLQAINGSIIFALLYLTSYNILDKFCDEAG